MNPATSDRGRTLLSIQREFFAACAACAAIVGLLIAWMLWLEDANPPSEYARVYDLDYVIKHHAPAIPITMLVLLVPLPLAGWLRRRMPWIERLRRLDDKVNPIPANDANASYRTLRRDFAFDCLMAVPTGAVLIPALGCVVALKIPSLVGWLGFVALLVVLNGLMLFLLTVWLLVTDFWRSTALRRKDDSQAGRDDDL